MKPRKAPGIFTVGVAALVAALAASPARFSAQTAPEVSWMADFDQACAVSRQTGKPLFVAFR